MLETTVKRLEEERSLERSQIKDLGEKTARLNKLCDEMKEDIRIVKKMLKKRREPVEILSDSSDTGALNESTCEEKTPWCSRQEEFIVVDKMPNALEREKSLEGPENFSFPDTATSPEGLNEFKFEGEFAVDVFVGALFATTKPIEVSL